MSLLTIENTGGVVMVEPYLAGWTVNVWKNRNYPFKHRYSTDRSSLFLQSALQWAVRKPVKILWRAKPWIRGYSPLVRYCALLNQSWMSALLPLLRLQKANPWTCIKVLLGPEVGKLPFCILGKQQVVGWTVSFKLRTWDCFRYFWSKKGLWNIITVVSSCHCPFARADCPFVSANVLRCFSVVALYCLWGKRYSGLIFPMFFP